MEKDTTKGYVTRLWIEADKYVGDTYNAIKNRNIVEAFEAAVSALQLCRIGYQRVNSERFNAEGAEFKNLEYTLQQFCKTSEEVGSALGKIVGLIDDEAEYIRECRELK